MRNLLVTSPGASKVKNDLLTTSTGKFQVGNNLFTIFPGNFHLEKVTGQPDQVGEVTGKNTAGSLAISPGVELTPGETIEKRTFFSLLALNFQPSGQADQGNSRNLHRLLQVWNCLMVTCKGEFQVMRNLFTASPGKSKVKNNLLPASPGDSKVQNHLLPTCPGNFQVVKEDYQTFSPPAPACAGWGLP